MTITTPPNTLVPRPQSNISEQPGYRSTAPLTPALQTQEGNHAKDLQEPPFVLTRLTTTTASSTMTMRHDIRNLNEDESTSDTTSTFSCSLTAKLMSLREILFHSLFRNNTTDDPITITTHTDANITMPSTASQAELAHIEMHSGDADCAERNCTSTGIFSKYIANTPDSRNFNSSGNDKTSTAIPSTTLPLLCSAPAVSVHRETRWLQQRTYTIIDAKTSGFWICPRPIRVEIWPSGWGNYFTIIHKTTIRRRLLHLLPRARARAASSSTHHAVSAAALSGSAHP